ncbi:MAG: thiamine pyrophosphate-binding protein [Proteobacteria bacterium]|jgi:sulfopyruvate decarboxylase alpha subunit|nr:thiamine pyrophosphate-binding protein [Pseudomonadota bacterium]MDA1302302.1 thiamine pyrophosphate-binding protein [Pseudomonadota bacterium]
MNEPASWQQDIFDVLMDHDMRMVAYVPDAGHIGLIDACQSDPDVTTVPLTTEEEGIALLSGAWLGGARGALLMQSSGAGNCMNMLSLAKVCRFPLLMLITMRGQWGEFNPWQVPMGQTTAEMLKLAGVITFGVDDGGDVRDTVGAAARMSVHGNAATAVLISQRLLGAKTFGN